MTFAVVAAAGLVHAAMQPIAGTNVVGFVEIAAPAAKNTIIAVPFEACMQAGVSGKLGDLVSTYGLTGHSSDAALADQLVVLTVDGGSPAYYYYYNDAEDGWTAITTEQIMPDGSKKTLTPPAASAFDVARGQGFWIKRAAGSGSTVYVQGQVSETKQATAIGEGLNLISYAALESFDLNAIDWSGAAGASGISASTDRILVSKGRFLLHHLPLLHRRLQDRVQRQVGLDDGDHRAACRQHSSRPGLLVLASFRQRSVHVQARRRISLKGHEG